MKFRCKVCGLDLVEQVNQAQCTYCGREEASDWSCANGHYICEACRTLGPEELIRRTCSATPLADPITLAQLLMKHPSFPAYGREHHSLAAPVILVTLGNRGLPGITLEQIGDSLDRIKDIPVSVCGTRGDCGAASSAGAVISILNRASPFSDGERTAALRATAQALMLIAGHGGPRCCKQAVFDTIRTTWELLRDEFQMDELPLHTCDFAGKLKDCKTTRCPYFD